jgi:hypothetical protein
MARQTPPLLAAIALLSCIRVATAADQDEYRATLEAENYTVQRGGSVRRGFYDFGGKSGFAEWTVRDATSHEQVDIAVDDIDEIAPTRTVMPDGLCDKLKREELLDLVRFLQQLGRTASLETDGRHKIRTWRVLRSTAGSLPDVRPPQLLSSVGADDSLSWEAAYSKVNGELPPSDLGTGAVAYVKSSLDATAGGRVMLKLDSAAGIELWIDGKSERVGKQTVIDIGTGRHELVFRIDRLRRGARGLTVGIETPADSPAQVVAVAGP